MRGHDENLERIRAGVSCATVLEGLQPGWWTLDRRESTWHCLKYRAGPGRILIVNHEGRGWWDPLSPAKGDVFDLVRHLDPGLGFGGACDVLRAFVGLGSSDPPAAGRRRRCQGPVPTPAARWAACRPVALSSPAWRYLAQERGLPGAVLAHAVRLGLLREGPRASAWFAHRDGAGRLTGIEMRGPAWRGFPRSSFRPARSRKTIPATGKGVRLLLGGTGRGIPDPRRPARATTPPSPENGDRHAYRGSHHP